MLTLSFPAFSSRGIFSVLVHVEENFDLNTCKIPPSTKLLGGARGPFGRRNSMCGDCRGHEGFRGNQWYGFLLHCQKNKHPPEALQWKTRIDVLP